MVRFVDRPASFAELALGGLERAMPSIQDLILTRQKEKEKQEALAERAPFGLAKYAKTYHPDILLNPEKAENVSIAAQNYIRHGLSETDSYRKAIEDYSKLEKGVPDKNIFSSFLGLDPENISENDELVKGLGNVGGKSLIEGIKTAAKETPGAVTKFFEELTPLKLLEAARHPGMRKTLTEMLQHEGPLEKQEPYFKMPSEYLAEAARAGLTPEQAQKAQETEDVLSNIYSILLPSAYAKAKGLISPEIPRGIPPEAGLEEEILERTAVKEPKSMAGRISKEVPETGTALRMERLEPGKKLYPTKERMEVRESQLKGFPKYETEIAQDAAERAARAESRVPKTEIGKASQQRRIIEAQSNLPKAEDSYRKSLARVRALENEVSHFTGEERKRLEALLNASKNDLREAEFGLKQARENLKGESVRAGLTEMRESAQKKMLDISEKVSDGKEVVLSKADYNPEMIKKAKELEKRAKLPAVREDDFYQQVHKEYGDQYRKRLDQIHQEIKDLPRNMSGVEQARILNKEADILKKLIDQVDAERALHRHKLALRETNERHKAAERLKGLKKTEGTPKVEKVAQEKIKEATKSFIENPTEEAAEAISRETGAPKEGVKKGKSLVDAIKQTTEDAAKGKEPKIGKIKQEFQNFKNAMKTRDWKELAENPFSRGLGQILADYVLNETDLADTIDIPGGVTAIGTVALGTRGRNPFIRNGIVLGYRLAKNNYKIGQYVDAVKRGDRSEVARMNKEYPPKLIKKAKNKLLAR